tara:strand:- start:405 stop:1331 length:927 start_codon:yes stop_codon:yes gene_type:complete
MKLKYSTEIKRAIKNKQPLLALESTIIAHGMPYPENFSFVLKAETLCRNAGVVPATIAIINGDVHVGLNKKQLKHLATCSSIKKVSRREIGVAISKKWDGATTVSSTMHIAYKAGISVFSTGGIGGVHRDFSTAIDVSQDIYTLSEIPMVVVSAGAKSILDLVKTVEMLETLGTTVLGYNTSEFPAFYSRSSGINDIQMVKDEKEIATIYYNNLKVGLFGATLVANPIPKTSEISNKKIESIIELAYKLAKTKNISGKNLTPFLLKTVVSKTGGKSLQANIDLAINNIKLGIKIAKAIGYVDLSQINT